ncbi:MAG: zinc ribbon domain-containing protein [bacterium]|jgi:hypothetical protein
MENTGQQGGFNQQPAPAAPAAVDFGTLFGKGTSLWTSNLGNLVVFTLVFVLVAWIPIANIGFIAGYIRGLLKTARGEKAEIGDLFNAWDCFGSAFLYVIILLLVGLVNLIPILGSLAYLVFVFFAYPGLFKVIDKNAGAVDALKWSFGAFKAAVGNWILCILVGGIMASLGGIVFGIGMIVTLPWGYLIIASQYETQKDAAF